jgi:Dolichyl-phosphate-mannose-protein mannosyltransferase
MSKSARKRPPVRRQAKPLKEKTVSPEKRERTQRFVVLAAIGVLAAIPFAMGKYIEFNSPCAFDGGAYVYSAEHITHGARIGVDEQPSAQMGTLLVNMLGVSLFGFNDTGPKLIQMLLQMAALVLMFVTLRKLFGTLAAAVGVIVASIYLSAPIIAKYGNVKEQHMIAFMILGVCCFVLYQLSGRWWQAVLAGAFLIFAPMFKETGTSSLGAVGLFVLAQPLLKHRTWKKTGKDILLLAGGAILVLAPICLWLAASGSPIDYYPYCFLYKPIVKSVESPSAANVPAVAKSETGAGTVQKAAPKRGLLMKFLPAYVRDSWLTMTPQQRREAKLRVLRWYWVLILPIALAVGAVFLRILKMILTRLRPTMSQWRTRGDKFVLLFGVWWFLDMAYVWISPRSYEQYYLPLNASGAMLGGYLVAAYYDKAKEAVSKPKWVGIGVLALIVMVAMSWRVFAGVTKSPFSGTVYRNNVTHLAERRNGYVQRLEEASQHRNEGARASWELVGDYIRENSTPKDEIYVWGWVPGIYVEAQRLSPAAKAFEGTMHTLSPPELSERVAELLSSFRKQPPKFIVDTYKIHFPWDRPPLELWPRTQKGFLPRNPQVVSQYEALYAKMLRERIHDPDEARRFEAMKPFRDYVMKNYRVVRTFGEMVLFQHK